MYRTIREALKKKLFRNVISLYAVQACTYLLPLLTFPYLGRVLGPEGWGAVIFAQVLGGVISIAVEYGFDFSGTREVARYSEDKPRVRSLVAGVLGAKAILALISVLLIIAIRPFTLRVAPSPALFWASIAWGVAQGINMLWYFQGLQRMAWSATLDVSGKLIATLSIFVFVRSPQDGWKVMVAQALGCAVSHAITVWVAYREVGFCWPTPRLIGEALRFGWPMFLFRASQSLMTSANGVILGFSASARAVGLFGGADRIRQITTQSLWPISQALFPHQSQRVTEDLEKGVKTVRQSLLWIGGLSTLFGIIVIIMAPFIVRIALGAAFLQAVPVLRVFGVIIPLTACASVICFQWMLPLGFDREFNLVVLIAGILNVAIGLTLAPKFGAKGMAIAVTVSELFALVAFDTALRRKGMSPLGRLRVHRPRVVSSRTIEETEENVLFF